MTTYIDSRQINLSADTADQYLNGSYLSNVVFNMSGMLKNEDDIVMTQISVHSAQIPISYYIVNYTNNTLVYKYHDDPITTIVFDTGNYNANTFITQFTSKIAHITPVLSKLNGKFIYTAPSSFTFYHTGSTCFKFLGLDANTDYTGTNITSPYPVQFQGITRLKIVSNELNTYSMDSNTGNFSNTLATLSVNSSAYGILLYDNTSQYKPILRNRDNNIFDIGILDDNDNFINFNNCSWKITLQLDITRLSNLMDRTFPKPNNNLGQNPDNPDIAQNPDNPDLGNTAPELVDLGTGDTDLDFLMYQNKIYQ